MVSDYKHTCEVQHLFIENEGVRLCFIDERHDTFIYNPVHDIIKQVLNTTSLNYVCYYFYKIYYKLKFFLV